MENFICSSKYLHGSYFYFAGIAMSCLYESFSGTKLFFALVRSETCFQDKNIIGFEVIVCMHLYSVSVHNASNNTSTLMVIAKLRHDYIHLWLT